MDFAHVSELATIAHNANLQGTNNMLSLGSEFGSTSSLSQEWNKLVALCDESDFPDQTTSRFLKLFDCLQRD